MKIEHVAFCVADPPKVAEWYVQNLGLRITRALPAPTHMHFLADTGNHVMIEIYNNPKVKVPDYRSMDPLLLHLAFSATDIKADRDRLLAAGATIDSDITTMPGIGDQLFMLRDPWGLAIQVVQRVKPMI